MKSALIPILAVASLNVVLNVLAKRVATPNVSFLQCLASWSFIGAFLVGTASLVLLVLVYRADLAVGSGILLMGAASIVGGSVLASLAFAKHMHWLEWALLAVIAALFALRWTLYPISPS